MATEIATLVARLEGDVRDFDRAMNGAKRKLGDVDRATKTTGKGFSGMAGAAKLAGAAFVGSQMVGFLKDATQAALEDEAAQVQLKLALENTVGATEAEVEATEKFIDTTQRATGIADDELRPALAELVRTTGDLEKAQETMGIAMDIATAKGVPLESVTRAIGKAALGNVTALGRMGVATKDAEGAVLDFDEVLQEAHRTMGGATEAAAATGEGAMRRFKVAFDEAKEGVGIFVIDALGRLAMGAQEVGIVWGEGSDAQKALQLFELRVGVVADTAAAAITIMHQFGQSFGDLAPHLDLSIEELLKMRDADDELLRSLGFSNEAIAEMDEQLEDELVRAAQAARSKGIHPLREEVEAATGALDEFSDEMRAAADPAFALFDASQNLAEAQKAYTDALVDSGPKSYATMQAALDLADAQFEAEAAGLLFAESSGESTTALENMMRAAGLTEEAIRLIIDSMLDYNATPLRNPIRFDSRTGAPILTPRVGQFQHGGHMNPGRLGLVGERGPEAFVPDVAGQIIPNNQLGGGVSGRPLIVQLQLDGKTLARIVRDDLVVLERRGGPR
jgi:hypothetical protein